MVHASNDSISHDPHTTVHQGLPLSTMSGDIPGGGCDPSPWNYELVSAEEEHRYQYLEVHRHGFSHSSDTAL